MGKPELELLLSKYNSAMGWATIAVAVGIFGEYIAHFVFSKEKRGRTELVFTVLFALCVLGGVVGEWWYGENLSGTATKLQRIADNDVADARRDASLANATAKSFESQIAASDARAKAAEAQVATAMAASEAAMTKAESFRLDIASAGESAKKAEATAAEANLELAKFKAPRMLTQQQRDRITGKLRPMAGQPFSFTVDFDPEAFDFLRVLDLIFRTSGWVRIPSQVGDVEIGGAGMAIGSGIAMQVLPDASTELKNRAESLASMFTAEGITAVTVSNPTLKNPNAINVMVGRKP